MTQPDRKQLLARLIDERNDEHGIGGAASLAREFGVSDAMVSGIRRGKYKGNTGRFLERVSSDAGYGLIEAVTSKLTGLKTQGGMLWPAQFDLIATINGKSAYAVRFDIERNIP